MSEKKAADSTTLAVIRDWIKGLFYQKPSSGIPKTDLASAVQTSLDKADTALQAHQDISGKVSGPSSATNNNVVIFDGTTGKVVKDSGFTIGKSVPSNAVFTDTDTKVTSVGNHYTPVKSATKSASGASGSSGTTVQVVTGVEVDAAGHVTGVVSGAATDTTYESKSASSGGTDVSLVTTGEKYTWNNKTSNTGTVTSITVKATSPIAIDSESAITTSGTRTISHANSGATAGSYGDSSAQTPSFGDTFKVPYVTVNATGHVTGISEHTVKIPAAPSSDPSAISNTTINNLFV